MHDEAGREQGLERLKGQIAVCRRCIDDPVGSPLPHAPRPVVRVSSTARLAIVGQAPGLRVHESGIPFDDRSGDRLRDWMGVDRDTFYDSRRIAIIPMGFCFPGYDAKGGDLPPRKECAPLWRQQVFDLMPQLELLLVIGMYAQSWHLGKLRSKTLTDTVANWRAIMEEGGECRSIPLPHPSWRNTGWLKKNPWFEAELLPVLRSEVTRLTLE